MSLHERKFGFEHPVHDLAMLQTLDFKACLERAARTTHPAYREAVLKNVDPAITSGSQNNTIYCTITTKSDGGMTMTGTHRTG